MDIFIVIYTHDQLSHVSLILLIIYKILDKTT